MKGGRDRSRMNWIDRGKKYMSESGKRWVDVQCLVRDKVAWSNFVRGHLLHRERKRCWVKEEQIWVQYVTRSCLVVNQREKNN